MKSSRLKLFGLTSLTIGSLFTLATLTVTQLYGPSECGYRTESATGTKHTLHGCEAERAGWPVPFVSTEITDFLVDNHTASEAPNGAAVSSRLRLDGVGLLTDIVLASALSFGLLIGLGQLMQKQPARRRKERRS